jgi:uncharacterized repeat protein (TIGR03803 family)
MRRYYLAGVILFSLTVTACASGVTVVPADVTATQALAKMRSMDSSLSIGCPCFNVLYDFGTTPSDGRYPVGSPTLLDGQLFGVTANGGAPVGVAYGTVYRLTTGGTETVLHSFDGSPDGFIPSAPLSTLNGALYGVTTNGGSSTYALGGQGVVFKTTANGAESVVYAFGTNSSGYYDARMATSPLLPVNGTLYGTSYFGGTGTGFNFPGLGTVFSVTPQGTESIVHSFSGAPDGMVPAYGALIDVNDSMYGTTEEGGNTYESQGAGTVYVIAPNGTESVLYRFAGPPDDGLYPLYGLVYADGMFYGTTVRGGSKNLGTIFSLTPGGVETVMHVFRYGGHEDLDGALPCGLVEMRGFLYGTTQQGGANNGGTIFRISTTGQYSRLYDFAAPGSSDGVTRPCGTLTVHNGILYGAASGGANGDGVIYSFQP